VGQHLECGGARTCRPKPQKRKRLKVERQPPWQHAQPARLFRVNPDLSKPRLVVEVRIAKNPKHMRAEIMRFASQHETDNYRDTAGLVRTYYNRITDRQVVRPCGVVARMFLNVRDLRANPNELTAHECTHAGMAWVRHCRANLRHMDGEEVLCYAVGAMMAQVSRICFAHRVYT
jgi:hypothetical protein